MNVEHILSREISGSGIERTLTPTCSCGWKGKGYAAHNDMQYTMVKEQEINHIKLNKAKK